MQLKIGWSIGKELWGVIKNHDMTELCQWISLKITLKKDYNEERKEQYDEYWVQNYWIYLFRKKIPMHWGGWHKVAVGDWSYWSATPTMKSTMSGWQPPATLI